MGPVVDKVNACGNRKVLLTERGSMFGYNNLVVDFRSLPILRGLGCPVVLDVTHSVQLPGGQAPVPAASGSTSPCWPGPGGRGVDALFMEVHPDPDHARCDGPNSLPLAAVLPCGGVWRPCTDFSGAGVTWFGFLKVISTGANRSWPTNSAGPIHRRKNP